MNWLVSVGALCVLASAAGADGHTPVVGVMTDVGVPDGATASLVVRPARAIRLELGVGHDGAGPGVRAGLTWIPLSSWITPVVSIGAGRFFETDANPVVRYVTGDATFSSPLLDRFGYDFAVARVGVEMGRRPVTFFVHAGVTAVEGSLHGLSTLSNDNMMSQVTVSSTDAHVRVVGVSVDLGLIFYLH